MIMNKDFIASTPSYGLNSGPIEPEIDFINISIFDELTKFLMP